MSMEIWRLFRDVEEEELQGRLISMECLQVSDRQIHVTSVSRTESRRERPDIFRVSCSRTSMGELITSILHLKTPIFIFIPTRVVFYRPLGMEKSKRESRIFLFNLLSIF